MAFTFDQNRCSRCVRICSRQQEQDEKSDKLHTEAEGYELASDGGYIELLKGALFLLFAYYNVRLFVVTVHGWEGYLTALFALLGEATAYYCLRNYTRSAGTHKTALGVFAGILTAFSVSHATISFFRMEQGRLAGRIQFYAEFVAFPLLFGLLLLAAVIIPLCHWRKRVAQQQAKAKVEIATNRAKLVMQSAKLKDKNELELERLNHFNEQIRMGNEYVDALAKFAEMKEREHAALARITNPEVRKEIANALGVKLDSPAVAPDAPSQNKPVQVWRGGQKVGNGLAGWRDDELPKV